MELRHVGPVKGEVPQSQLSEKVGEEPSPHCWSHSLTLMLMVHLGEVVHGHHEEVEGPGGHGGAPACGYMGRVRVRRGQTKTDFRGSTAQTQPPPLPPCHPVIRLFLSLPAREREITTHLS